MKINIESSLNDTTKLCISCMVCGESIELTNEEIIALDYGKSIGPKICQKCCGAIICMRRNLESLDEYIKKSEEVCKPTGE